MADAATTSIDPSQSTLSANFAPYVYDMLARGQAAASQPFQEYTGQRFAGPSALQQQAFQGLASLVGGGMGGYGGGFGYQPQMPPRQQALGMPQDGGLGGVGGMPTDQRYTTDDFLPRGRSQVGKAQPAGGLLDLLARSARGEDMSGFQLPQGTPEEMAAKMAPRPAPGTEPDISNFNAAMGGMGGPMPQDGAAARRSLAQYNAQAGMGGYGGGIADLGGYGGQGGMPSYPSQFDTATRFLTQAGQRAGSFNYQPREIQAPQLTQYQLEAPQAVQGAQAQAAQLSAAPTTEAAQFQGPGQVGFERAQAERVAAPQIQNLSMQAAKDVGVGPLQTFQMGPAQQVSTSTFTPQSAAGLMSPYMQSVVDVQQKEAQRQADIARGARGAQYAKAGAFGGARQAIENAEAARNLQTQLGGIQAQGLQSAYQQAQQQFNTQQQAALQAALANQQAGLTTGQQNLAAQLGVQQLGTQSGLQAALANQQAQQQANLQNLSAGLQTQGLQAQTGLQAQQLNQATGLQAQLANQQAGINTGQFNAQQAYNTALQNAQMRQQAALANQQLAGQYGLQQGQFGQQAGLQNAQMAQQAALANQQAGMTAGQQNLQALLGIQQLGAGQNLQAQQLNQAAQQAGANLGLQALQQQAQAGTALGNLGASQYGTQLSGLGTLLNAGGIQQQLAQQPLDFGYQQYQQSLQYPYQQATFMQSLLGGLPLQAPQYSSGATGFGSALQGGLAGLGMYNALFGGK